MNLKQPGILAYNLPVPFCPECSRPLGNRWLMTGNSGCATCDEAVTRHRCTGRPDRESLDPGDSWECPDCGSTWTAIEIAGSCGECGQETWEKTWEAVEGDRMATAPRYKPTVLTPFRDPIPRAAESKCHRTPGGIMIHVKPDCRCR